MTIKLANSVQLLIAGMSCICYISHMHIMSLAKTPLEQIRQTIESAFSDYEIPITFSLESLKDLMESRDVSLDCSFGCFEKEVLIGCILGGFRDSGGKRIIYNATTGVTPEYRGKGIGTQLLNELITYARKQAIALIQLEVLEKNFRAQSTYLHAGFVKNRVLNCFTMKKQDLIKPNNHPAYFIKPLQKSDFREINHATFLDFIPSWQNDVRSVHNIWSHVAALAVMKEDMVIGYGIINRIRGDYPQIAVMNNFEADKIRTVLIYVLAQLCESHNLTIINVEAQSPLSLYLSSSGWKNYVNQIEMIHTML